MWVAQKCCQHGTVPGQNVSMSFAIWKEKAYAAVPTRTLCTSALVNNDMSTAKDRTEINTVAETHPRVMGIQSSKKTGMIRMLTVSKIVSSRAMTATLDSEYWWMTWPGIPPCVPPLRNNPWRIWATVNLHWCESTYLEKWRENWGLKAIDLRELNVVIGLEYPLILSRPNWLVGHYPVQHTLIVMFRSFIHILEPLAVREESLCW